MTVLCSADVDVEEVKTLLWLVVDGVVVVVDGPAWAVAVDSGQARKRQANSVLVLDELIDWC